MHRFGYIGANLPPILCLLVVWVVVMYLVKTGWAAAWF